VKKESSLIVIYNLAIFLLALIYFKVFVYLYFVPIAIFSTIFFLHPKIIKQSPSIQLLVQMAMLFILVTNDYYLVGLIDKLSGGLPRLDHFFANFDSWLFGDQFSILFEQLLANLGNLLSKLLNDLLITVYVSYFLNAFIVGTICYQFAGLDQAKTFFFSLMLFYMINFLLYLLVPVTGPQFFLSESYQNQPLFSAWGRLLYSWVREGQTTFIDGFPSGHFGVTFLLTIWLFNLGHRTKYLFLAISLLMAGATMALRFHYSLDLLAAVPLAAISFYLGKRFKTLSII